MLPSRFIEKADITRDVVIVGVGHRAEIWAKEHFAEVYDDEDEELDIVLPI